MINQIEKIVKISGGIIGSINCAYRATTIKVICDNINDVNKHALMWANKNFEVKPNHVSYLEEGITEYPLSEITLYGYRTESISLKGVKNIKLSHSFINLKQHETNHCNI